MDNDKLVFRKASSDQDIQDIFDHTIDAFSDSPDFEWSMKGIKDEIKDGWELYAALLNDEIIAAALLKIEGDILHSKNTSTKMNYQGSGFSHKVKDFFETFAREKKLKKIVHYCRIDNFRMYSLNESHGFSKTDRKLGEDGQVVEWVKDLTK